MAISRAAIVARVPALDAVDDPAAWEAAIADAQLQVSSSVWGDLYELGVIYLAAHLLLVANPEVAGPGPVQSETVGSISRTYAVTAPTREQLGSTLAGREHIRLRRQLGLGAALV